MASSTTVRIEARHKAHLERLRDDWRRRTGRAPTQQDLLGHLVEYAATHLDKIIDEASWRALTPAEFETLCTESVDLGHPTDLTKDIDPWVYDPDHETGRQ